MRQRVERRIKDCETDRDGEQDEEQEEGEVVFPPDVEGYLVLSVHSNDTYTVHLCI